MHRILAFGQPFRCRQQPPRARTRVARRTAPRPLPPRVQLGAPRNAVRNAIAHRHCAPAATTRVRRARRERIPRLIVARCSMGCGLLHRFIPDDGAGRQPAAATRVQPVAKNATNGLCCPPLHRATPSHSQSRIQRARVSTDPPLTEARLRAVTPSYVFAFQEPIPPPRYTHDSTEPLPTSHSRHLVCTAPRPRFHGAPVLTVNLSLRPSLIPIGEWPTASRILGGLDQSRVAPNSTIGPRSDSQLRATGRWAESGKRYGSRPFVQPPLPAPPSGWITSQAQCCTRRFSVP
jgi:hypothetical protein